MSDRASPKAGERAALLSDRRSTEARWSQAAGVAAAVVIAVLINVLGARHYKRWDWTSAGIYTISPLSQQTLRELPEPIQIHVLLSAADPLELSLRHLLEAYRAETRKLDVRFIDPDTDAAEFFAVKQRFGIVAGKTDDGRVVSDTSLVISRGQRHHFITADELVQVDEGDEERARPRLEQALTGGIRAVLAGEPIRVCISSGHGEPELQGGGAEGLGALDARLRKLFYDPRALRPLRDVSGRDDIDDCRVLIVASPSQALDDAELGRIERYVEAGGNLLVASGPLPDERDRGYLELRVDRLYALAGVRRRDDFVFERDPGRRSSQGFGETFLAEVKPHAVTNGMIRAAQSIPVVVTVASSLVPIEGSAVAAVPLLTSSEASFGMVDFWSWADKQQVPEPSDGDQQGPLALAYAAEHAKRDAQADHGARVVVLATASPIYGANWQTDQLRGTALLIESAISWLAAEPIVLDIPSKPSRSLGHGITHEMMTAALWKVLGLLPGCVVLLGVVVRVRRRAGEKRPPRKAGTRHQAAGTDEREPNDEDEAPAEDSD
jgi:hypothetical protein